VNKRVGVVIPSNRPERIEEFKLAWAKDLEETEARLYVVEDSEDTWDLIRKDLGNNSWIIPCRTDCIRSYGFLCALRDGMDVTISLDDDVRPLEGINAIQEHIKYLDTYVEPDEWVRTLRGANSPPTRGLPQIRRVLINHGLWTGVPDVSAKVQIAGYRQDYNQRDPDNNQIIPRGSFYPMSGMNVAFGTSITPLMYFTLQGRDIRDPEKSWGLHRCGDILAGILSKAVMDNFYGAAVRSGEPYVYHSRASDPHVNLVLEENTHDLPWILSMRARGANKYTTIAERLYNLRVHGIRKDYFRDLANAMRIWTDLCQKG
jgi:hypothetical protein